MFRAFALAALALFGGATAAVAEPVVADPCAGAKACAQGLAASDVFAIAERYASAGDLAAAETLLGGLTRDPNPEYRAEARFRLSIVREARGDRGGAIEALKSLLDEKPNATRPRLELARLLAATGDEAGARRELRRAGAAGLPDDVARIVDRFALALRSNRSIGGSFEVGIAPDSNINRATTRESVDTVIAPLLLDRDARAQSDIGLSLAGQAFARAPIAKGVTLLSRLSARADLYGKSRFNDVAVTLASGPEFVAGGARIRPAGVFGRRWFGGRLFSENYGGSLNILKPLDRTSQVEAELTLLDGRFPTLRVQDGLLADLSVNYDKALSPRFSTRIGLRATRQEARAAFFASTSAAVDLLASRAFGKQLVFAQASATRLWGDGPDALFGATRNDRRLDLSAGVILRRFTFRGLAPLIRLTRTWSDSTVAIYDFRRTRVEFALSREF